MDERTAIPRREAVAGLAALGALSLALVGTIVFRIVHAAPRPATPTPAMWTETEATKAPRVAIEAESQAPVVLDEPALPPVAPVSTGNADASGDGLACRQHNSLLRTSVRQRRRLSHRGSLHRQVDKAS